LEKTINLDLVAAQNHCD